MVGNTTVDPNPIHPYINGIPSNVYFAGSGGKQRRTNGVLVQIMAITGTWVTEATTTSLAWIAKSTGLTPRITPGQRIR